LTFVIPGSLAGSPGRLAIYDARGQLMRVLVDEAVVAGSHDVAWNGEDANGRVVPSGVYYAELQVGPLLTTCKLSVLK
jgi:flagellar hook assembly protein FlgD